jgi:hypothetical protein
MSKYRSTTTVNVTTLDEGGVNVAVHVPTYDEAEEVTFTLRVERAPDGDWTVFVPWFKDLHGNPCADMTDLILANGVGVTNGICYVGAPDEDAGEEQDERCESCECNAGSKVPGALWPIASDGDDSHMFVERCDECERYELDEDAALAVRQYCEREGIEYSAGAAYLHSDMSGRYPQPYVDTKEVER